MSVLTTSVFVLVGHNEITGFLLLILLSAPHPHYMGMLQKLTFACRTTQLPNRMLLAVALIQQPAGQMTGELDENLTTTTKLEILFQAASEALYTLANTSIYFLPTTKYM